MKPPVFVLGAPRSGTTLLYHMLLSSGEFAVFMAETHVFNLVGPRFGPLTYERNRRALMDAWVQSFQFKRSGLRAENLRTKVMKDCRCEGDFLKIFMEQVAEEQQVERWAECTPEHLLFIQEIKRELPDAKVIHIIRDGRDVALSEVQQGWVRPFPWDRAHQLSVSGLYWEWIVRIGREQGRTFHADYMEVRFEQLVANPRETLPEIANFIGQPLDYDLLLGRAVGSLKSPNTSFASESTKQEFHPVGRWRTKLGVAQLSELEATIGGYLLELGYPLSDSPTVTKDRLTAMRLRATYPLYFGSKSWLKFHTPLRRLTSIDLLRENA